MPKKPGKTISIGRSKVEKVERIDKLIKAIHRDRFEGIGKSGPLKHALAGFWSRRITDEHRAVYKVEGIALLIAKLRFHY